MQPTIAAPLPSEMPAATRSKPLSTILPCALPKIATAWSASSIAIPNRRRLPLEAPYPRFAWRQSQYSDHLGGRFPGPRRSGLLPLASRAAVLRPAAHHSRTKRTSRPFPQRTALLHFQGTLETPLVPEGLWL